MFEAPCSFTTKTSLLWHASEKGDDEDETLKHLRKSRFIFMSWTLQITDVLKVEVIAHERTTLWLS